MSNALTTPAPDALPARCGTLGIGTPLPPKNLGPYDALAEITRRTGHEFELKSSEFHFFVFDWTVGDAAGEGATREEALESALENV